MRAGSTRWSALKQHKHSERQYFREIVAVAGIRYHTRLTKEQRDYYRSWSRQQLIGALVAGWMGCRVGRTLVQRGYDETALRGRFARYERHMLICELALVFGSQNLMHQ